MKMTGKFLTTSSVVTALLVSGCAAPKAVNRRGGLSTQQLHNVAEPATSSWLPKFMQPAAAQPKFGGENPSHLAGKADQPATKNPKQKKVDPLLIARLQERRGQLEQAGKIYERELATNPKKAHIHHRLAVIAAREGQWDKSREHFTKACQLEPRNSEILGDLGYALYLQHQLSDAESCLLAAVEANPQNKSAQNNLGIVLGVQGKYDQSLAAFRRAVPDAEAHANLGYVHMQLGDGDKAMGELNQALSLDSSLKTAALALVQINDLKQRLGPKDLDRMTIAANLPKATSPVGPAEMPTTAAQPVAEAVANEPKVALSAPSANLPTVAAAGPAKAERPIAEPALFKRQLVGNMTSELKQREAKNTTAPSPSAPQDSRIKEDLERLPAPSPFVSPSGLGSKDSAPPALVSQATTQSVPVPEQRVAIVSSVPLTIKSEGTRAIAAVIDPSDSVVQASGQVNTTPPLLAIPTRAESSTLTAPRNNSSKSVPVYKPSARIQQMREQNRTIAESRQKAITLDNLVVAKISDERILLLGEATAVNIDSVLAHSQTLANSKVETELADLATAVRGAQSFSARSAVVKPTMGASPAMVPQVSMPRPEDMLPAHAQMNRLPTHQLHPTASPTWSAPSTTAPTGNPNSGTVKGPLPRVKVMPN